MSRASVFAVIALAAASAAALPAQAQEADRYGPTTGPGAAPDAPQATYAPAPRPAAAPLRGRMLSWPGKLDTLATAPSSYAPSPEAPRPTRTYAPRTYAAAPRRTPADAPVPQGAPAYRQPGPPQAYADAPRPARYASTRYRGSAVDGEALPAPVAQDGWRPVFGGGPSHASALSPPAQLAGAPEAAPPRRAPLPTSIYAPAPGASPAWSPGVRAAAAPPPLRSASAAQRYGYDPTQNHGVRFYSVHRPFGLQPDPAPIPPQFFTATADLAEPPGPLPTDHTTTTATGTTHTNRVVSDSSAN